MNVYRRGGDSLLGRYWLLHLHPFSVSEVVGNMNPLPPKILQSGDLRGSEDAFNSLLKWGGFPEPFLKGSSVHHRRWIKMRREILIREDLRDLSKIHDLTHIENMMDLVIASVGSLLSVNSLRETLDVSYNAVKSWLRWLEAIYYCFRIPPYSKSIAKGLKKESKYFLHDWSEIQDAGARFENMMAVHLKKSVDFWNDTGIGNFDLNFVRDVSKREVDFLILKDKRPWMLVECKVSGNDIPMSLQYMTKILKPEFSVLVTSENQDGQYRVIDGTKYWFSGASDFLTMFV